MTDTKPKRALLAYCALAQKLNTPGVGITGALIPFLAGACKELSGELFDAEKFSKTVARLYGFSIPRLAALGLTDSLHREGLLTVISSPGNLTVFRHSSAKNTIKESVTNPLTEAQVDRVLQSFFEYCSLDEQLKNLGRDSLNDAFLNRLLNADSMRMLGRKEASISVKRSAETLVLPATKQPGISASTEDLHLDFKTSQFLLDLKENDAIAFEVVSDVAFASMAAEAIACFCEPEEEGSLLEGLTVYLDSPILLDMLGVNTEYADYGKELLATIKESGAKAAVFDHCVEEAEAAVSAQLAYLRSGINTVATKWGTSAKPDLLNALIGNVGKRAYERLGVFIERDPDATVLHKRAPKAVGSIEAEIGSRMQHWGNLEAKDHDRKSVWSLLAIRDSAVPCPRICDSKWIFLSRNTALVGIANDAWRRWLTDTTKHSAVHVAKWAPVSMSDKQFAGYAWARRGGGKTSIPKARLLANCSAAVRPRADVKARAYNLVLELNGKEEADDLAAMFEDREGAKSLMRATSGDPEDVTTERLPYILEQIKLGAGKYAADKVREESERQLRETTAAHEAELERVRRNASEINELHDQQRLAAQAILLQEQQERENLAVQNEGLQQALKEHEKAEAARIAGILGEALTIATKVYDRARWLIAILFGSLIGYAAFFNSESPMLSICLTIVLGTAGFWFVPEFLHGPINWMAMRELRKFVRNRDRSIEIPSQRPDFRNGNWAALSSVADGTSSASGLRGA